MDTTTGEKRVPSLGFRWLILITSATTYALIVLGGIVRATESGDACPDWPRCRGELIPPLESSVLIEFSHRLLASVVGLLIVATAVVAWRERHRAPVIFWGAAACVALVGGQIVLGGLTVLNDLPSNLVMAHLALAATLLATLLTLTLVSFASEPAERPPSAERASAASFRNLAVVAALAMFALMLTGSYVSGSGAGLAFRDWPLFDGRLLPEGGRLAMIHATHRLAALLVGLLVVATAVVAWRERHRAPIIFWGATAAVALVGGQIVLGGLTVLNDLPSSLVMAHLALAALLLAMLLTLTLVSFASEPAERPAAAEGASAASFRNLAIVAAVATFALMLTGSYVSGSGAGLAFRDWPLFNGQLLPEGGRLAMIHATHRLAALLVGLLLAYVAVRAWRSQQRTPIVMGTAFALALYVAQALVGAANVWTMLQPAAIVAHLALAVALWSTLVAVAVLAHGPALERTLASAGEGSPWPADSGAVAAARGQS